MPAKDLGTKHACFKCGTKFYDLRKAPAICPKCGADQKDSPALKAPPAEKRSRAAARPPPPPVVPDVEDAEAEVVADEDDVDDADTDDDAGDDDEP
jgi:uncharacterized protein (TIGR02300 family)